MNNCMTKHDHIFVSNKTSQSFNFIESIKGARKFAIKDIWSSIPLSPSRFYRVSVDLSGIRDISTFNGIASNNARILWNHGLVPLEFHRTLEDDINTMPFSNLTTIDFKVLNEDGSQAIAPPNYIIVIIISVWVDSN
jgi:hypothetical protein